MSSAMEFWGVEVKAGKPLKVTLEDDVVLHLSHAALGEAKKTKETEFVSLFIKVGEKKLVLGTLSPETIPQLAFDLVLEQEFELSHNWKNGSIFFTGYKTVLPDDHEEFSDFGSEDESEEEKEEVPVVKAENGKVQKAKPPSPAKAKAAASAKAAAAKLEAAKPKSKAAAIPTKPENESDESDDSDDDSFSDDSDDDESGEDMSVDTGAGDDSDDSDDDDDSEDSEDEETPTPKKPEQGKKRSNDSAVKTPVPAKKAKQTTPAKTDGKKSGHPDTPHPAKKAAKTAGSAAKTPKSGGEFACKSCDKSFGSDGALQSHSKAKHTAK